MTDENEKIIEIISARKVTKEWIHPKNTLEAIEEARQQGIEIGRKTAFGNLVTNVEEVEQAAYERGKKAGWKEAMNGITQVQEVHKAELKKAVEDERERLLNEIEERKKYMENCVADYGYDHDRNIVICELEIVLSEFRKESDTQKGE